mgnify:FL=1
MMDTNSSLMFKQNKRLISIVLAVPILLLIPFIAMYYSSEVKWTLFDFCIAGLLLTGAGLSIEFILRKVKSGKQRIALVFALIIAFLLIWAELAVGIFNTPIGGH